MNKKKVSSFTTEDIGDLNSPICTQEALEAEKIRNTRLAELGIPYPGFGTGGREYTQDEKEAMLLIVNNRVVPKELADRIIQYHKENPILKSDYKMKIASPEIIEKVLGTKK